MAKSRKGSGKSPKQPPKSGMLSIVKMFEKQRQISAKNSHYSSNSDDEDVIIVGEDKTSPYFTHHSKQPEHGKGVDGKKPQAPRSRRKLSLAKEKEKQILSDKKIPPSGEASMLKVLSHSTSKPKNTDVKKPEKEPKTKSNPSVRGRMSLKLMKRQNADKKSDPECIQSKKICMDASFDQPRNLCKTRIPPSPPLTLTGSSTNDGEDRSQAVLNVSTFTQKPNEDKDEICEISDSTNSSNGDSVASDLNETSQNISGDDVLNPQTDHQHDNVKEGTDQNNSEVDASGSDKTEPQYRTPYYLNNFETILQSVMQDETNKNLFNVEDMALISKYEQLSEPAKKLYIRMFSRKLHWIPLNKLKYPEIAEDLTPYLQELTQASFIDNDENLTDLEEVLNALTVSDIKMLAKSYHLNSSCSQKQQFVQELLKKSQQSNIATMFGSHSGGVAQKMMARAKKHLDGIYRLRVEPRGVFVRAMMLFSLISTTVDDDTGTGGQGQLFHMLMVNMGKVVYPTYTVEKTYSIFKDRQDVIRFERALQLESDLLQCTEKGNWAKAYDVFKTVEEEWKVLEENEDIVRWNKNLPDFLRSFTATSVIYRLLSAGIEILQRRKDFEGAVKLLEGLLAQEIYHCSHRGYWWERLALNLDAHLKQPLQSLDAVGKGLADPYVRVGHRYALYLRAESICSRPKLKLKHRLKEFYHEIVEETPKVYISGRVIHQGVLVNGTRFLTDDSVADGSSQDMTVCGVEEYVLSYYRKNGYPSGIHAEGSVVSALFTLFFWDILFMPVPDAFHSPYQTQPLDLHSDMFYERRKDRIEERLAQLENTSVEDLQAEVEKVWTSQEGVTCAGFSSERMRSMDTVKELVGCMGGRYLSGIVGRYARCPRHTRSGFPDLTLWNAETGAFKICEVKGPGDRLSNKQILWIDYLRKLGVDAEVCHVKAVAAKKLKPSTSLE